MKKFLAFILSLIVIGGAVAIAYPFYTDHVEKQIANWVVYENARDPDMKFSYTTLDVKPLLAKVILHGLIFETTEDIAKVERFEISVDSFLFLNEVKNIKQAQFLNYSKSSKTDKMKVSVGIVTLTNITGNLASLTYSASDGIDIYREISVENILVEVVKFENQQEDSQMTISQTQFFNIQNGVIQETTLDDISIAVDKAKLTIGRFSLGGMNIIEPLQLANLLESDEAQEPTFHAVMQALNLQRVKFHNLTVKSAGHPPASVASFVISDVMYLDGMPVALTAIYNGINSPISEGFRRDLSQGIGSQIYTFLPDRVLANGTVNYELDTQKDHLKLSLMSYDTATEIETQVNFDIRNIVNIFETLRQSHVPREQDAMRLAIGGMSIRLENKTSWGVPEQVAGKPTPRLFLLNTLRTLNLSASLDMAMRQPIQDFLTPGGILEISVNPPQPIALLEFMFMQSARPEVILQTIGFSATHSQN